MREPLRYELHVAFGFAQFEVRGVPVIVRELELGRVRPLGGREFGVWPLVQTCDQQTAINSAEY